MKNYLLLNLLFIIALSGCATDKAGHIYAGSSCITCLNDPITGDPYNYEKEKEGINLQERYRSGRKANKKKEIKHQEGHIKFYVGKDVDVVYLKLKREFGFKTRKERERGMFYETREWLDVAEEFRYEALPGVSYHLREYTKHLHQGVMHQLTIDLVIEKSEKGTAAAFTYWIQLPPAQLSIFSNSIKKRALKALHK